jgi:type IV pilus assembly protein PilC
MEFRCRLAASSGEVTEGVYVAESESRLRHDLAEKGMYVLSMRPKGSLGGLLFRLPSRTRLSTREFLMFNQELATLLKAGMPLVQSLDLLRGRIDTPGFRAVLDDVHDRVRAGSALSDAFAAHGDLFPSVYTASLLAGERSGSLETVLRRFVEYTRVIDTVKRKAISALIYPAVLTTLAVGLVGLIVLWVVPAFTDFYSSFDAELPLATRAIVAVSLFARDQIVWVFLGLVAVAGACESSIRPVFAACSGGRRRRPKVRHLSDGAHIGDPAGWRPSSRQRARHRHPLGRESIHRPRARGCRRSCA